MSARSGARGGRVAARTRIDVARDGVRGGLTDGAVRRIAGSVLRAERARVAALSVTMVSDARMRRINRRHLGRAGLTDVIAFALPATGDVIAGDIYIAPGAARSAAAEHGVPLREELTRLIVHGVLHVLGWNHPEGAGRTRSAMWRRQEALVRRALRAAA